MIRVIDKLTKAIRSAAVYNPDVQVAPACILWPDRDRQWEAIIPRMQIELPELFVLGENRGHRCYVRGRIIKRVKRDAAKKLRNSFD